MGFLYWAMTVTGSLFMLTALPILFAPYTLGIKMYMPYKLPQGEKTEEAQLAFMMWMNGFAQVALGVFTLYLTNYCLCLPGAGLIVLAIFSLCCYAAWMHFSGKAEMVGMDNKTFYANVAVFTILMLCIVYGIIDAPNDAEWAATSSAMEANGINLDDPVLTWTVVGYSLIQLLNSLPAVIMPVTFIGLYWPNKPPKSGLFETQLALLVRGQGIAFSWLALLTAAAMLMANASIYLTGALFALMNFIFTFVMGHMTISGGDYGADIKMIVPWLALNQMVVGICFGAYLTDAI